MAADIVAAEVVVSGNLKGNVLAKNQIEIKKDGSVTGDLTTPRILIEDGAFFKATIEIDTSVEKGTRRAPARRQHLRRLRRRQRREWKWRRKPGKGHSFQKRHLCLVSQISDLQSRAPRFCEIAGLNADKLGMK